ncbi:MAG: efflux RND transporter periplasmic adaptor subunit, partial [Bacteroidales bacterium]
EQNAVSRLDLENAVAALENAQASVSMSKADLDQAELELSYTTVRSPISGYVSERHVDIGSLVGGSGKSLLATVVETDTVLVDFKMTALDYLKSKKRNVSIGERDSSRSWQPTVTVTLADNSVYPLKGIVDFADPQVDPQTGTFTVRAQLYNPERKLLPGQFTKVKLLLDVVENAIIIPRKAVSIETGGAYVYVMKRDSTAERRFIEIAQELENEVIIERGLSVYDQIVTEGFHKLKPGTKARFVHSWDKATMDSLKKEDE